MTKIEWTHVPDGNGGFKKGETLNYQVGCVEKSPACRNCYAASTAHLHAKSIKQHAGLTVVRSNGVHWNGEINRVPKILAYPLHWREPRGIFVGSMTDAFLRVDTDEDMRWIAALFGVMAATPRHTYMLLTKRPANARRWFAWVHAKSESFDGKTPAGRIWSLLGRCAREIIGDEWGKAIKREKREKRTPGSGVAVWPLPNVWLGATTEDQQRADENVPELLRCPAVVHYASYEPACGPVDFRSYLPHPFNREPHCEWCEDCIPKSWGTSIERWKNTRADNHGPFLDWVIAGGESGPRARPSHPDWFRSVRDQCVAAGTPFFFKQNGEFIENPDEPYGPRRRVIGGRPDDTDREAIMVRVGKTAAGRELDGRMWDEFPEVHHG